MAGANKAKEGQGEAASRILIVDDIEDNRYTLRRRLKRLGYLHVDEACDGREALDALAANDFDAVLLDIMMPEVNGYEVLEKLREQGRLSDPPIIVISALDEMDSVVQCIELGAEDYLTKPFNPTLLRARLHATLEKKRLRDAAARQLHIIREVFGRFVPEAVASAIVAGEGSLEPRQAVCTVLYTDIESFTTITESLGPTGVVHMLNEYFPAVIEPIERHGGVVNQFQGDAMLVTFNVPVEDPSHAENAIAAARSIAEVCASHTFGGVVNQFQGDAMLVTFNVPVEDPSHAENAIAAARSIAEVCASHTFGGVRLRTRIGVNTGAVVAGNVGSGQRMNYTVHGDAVNVAARLEAMNKEQGTTVLVSASTARMLNDTDELRRVGELTVRGKDDTVEVYSLDLD